MNKIIVGDQIVKRYGTGSEARQVLNRVSVEIGQGEFVAVMGPSGSGKSTLMFCLSGMDAIDEGGVLYNGKPLSQMGEVELADLRRRRMGFVFQQPTLLRNLNVLDNILLPSLRDNRKQVAALTDKARSLMKRVGIAGLESREITQVSGGQLQRVGICRALMGDPDIIFGDEPTGALNSASAQEMMELFTAIHAEGTAIMLVTHDAQVAARAERVLFMRDGAIASELLLSRYRQEEMAARVRRITERMTSLGV